MISHLTPSRSVSQSSPIESGGRIRNKLVFTMFLLVLGTIFLLEVVQHLQVGQADQRQAALRLLITLPMMLAVALALSLYIARGWGKQAASIKTTLDTLAAGNARARAEVLSDDELGAIAIALNRWRDAVANPSISSQPSGRVHGSPRQLIDAALRLSMSANELQTSTEKLSQDSESDLAQINDTSSAVDEIVESIRQVAENTSTSAKVAAEARETAIIGSQAVSNTMKGMQRIRNQVQSTSKRIKQLGESTQQIGEIVQLISDVADRTSLLALNASIQAAMAGEAGQGFGVVAEEVERLSQRCNEATKQIAKLVKSVQSETSEAIAGMEESIAEVVEGSKLASQAGEALADIDAVSDRLAELINTISTAAKQQVRGGLLASRSMSEISAVIHDKALGTKQAAQAVTQLASLAGELFATVERWQGSNGMQPLSGDSAASGTPTPDMRDGHMPPAPLTQPGVEWSPPVVTGSATR